MSRSAVRKDDAILQEAVDHLAKIIEINPDEWIKAKAQERKRFWIDVSNASEVNYTIKSTLHLIHEYLKKNFPAKKDEFDPSTSKGFSAIWLLAQEAVDKIDQINSLFHTEITQSVRDTEEYKELEKTLYQKLSPRIIEEELGSLSDVEQVVKDETQLSLKTLDAVKRDDQYELFYIKQENGAPFFALHLLKNVKLLIDFEQMILPSQKEDPFVAIPLFQDRVIFSLARSIKDSADQTLGSFIKIYQRFSHTEVAKTLYKAVISLYLAALSENRIDAKKRKVCTRYFEDFLYFLNLVIHHPEYQKITHEFHETHSDLYRLAQTARMLCFSLFTAVGKLQFEEEFLREIKADYNPQKGMIWQRLFDVYEFIKIKLKSYPSGPLMKILDLWQEGGRDLNFNPLVLKNYPRLLYKGKHEKGNWECIHLPAPVHQAHIGYSPLLKEFAEALAYMEENHHRKWVVFNLQDRSSYYESARARALEELQYRAPYQKVFLVVTLPKNSEFYHQMGYYAEINLAETFIETFMDQLADHEVSGYFFPKEIEMDSLILFSKKLMHWLHNRLFMGIEIMRRELRQDFIELFYAALSWKILAQIEPSLFSFVSKDGVDLGAMSEAEFYGFMLMLQNKLTFEAGEKIELMSFVPALFQRERLIDEEVFHRMVRSLATLDFYLEKNKELSKELIELLGVKNWKTS